MTVFTDFSIRIPFSETARYMGCRGEMTEELKQKVTQIISQAEQVLDCRVCCERFPLLAKNGCVKLGQVLSVQSADLCQNLQGCREVYLFCATVGTGIDRKIAANRLHPADAVVWDAAGTAAVEQLCDELCARFGTTKPRFSPGYGDVPLALQRELLRILDAQHLLGVGLTDSLLMTPTKSVTAFAGVI